MKRPTWATIVGVLGIIFSCFGILGASQEIMKPTMSEMKQEFMTTMEEAIKNAKKKKAQNLAPELTDTEASKIDSEVLLETFKSMQKMWDTPAWYDAWMVFGGVVKAILSGFYLLVCIWLLQLKPSAVKLFYLVVGLGLILTVVKGIVGYLASSTIGLAMLYGSILGLVIDAVLLIVVFSSDKSAFVCSNDHDQVQESL